MLATSKTEAYVTFTSDRNAYLALLQHDFDREAIKPQPFHIQPADSWIQPKENVLIEHHPQRCSIDKIQTSAIFQLNVDCMLHLFKFLDLNSLVNMSEVCKMFHTLLHQHCFPHIQQFTVYNLNDTFSMPLAKMRRTLRCIGPYITDLKYTCNIYNDPNRMSRFLEALVKYIGPNIRRAQFLSSLICEDNQILIIAPFLRHLESLEIHDMNFDCDNDIDFEELCPNLIELKLNINMRLNRCCKPWQQLQHLSIMNNEYLNTITFKSFIEQNPHLQTIEFDVFDAEQRLYTVANHLPMLQKLTIDSVDSSLGAWNFVHLIGLQHLTEIHLLTINYEHLRGIFDCLATFHGLHKLSVHGYSSDHYVDNNDDDEMDYEKSLIILSQQLLHLEEFSLRSIPICEKTLINFLKFARQLNVIHIHWCHLDINDSIILNIVNMLKCQRSANETLLMYVSPADLLNLQTNKTDEIKSFLRLSAKCQHFGF